MVTEAAVMEEGSEGHSLARKRGIWLLCSDAFCVRFDNSGKFPFTLPRRDRIGASFGGLLLGSYQFTSLRDSLRPRGALLPEPFSYLMCAPLATAWRSKAIRYVSRVSLGVRMA